MLSTFADESVCAQEGQGALVEEDIAGVDEEDWAMNTWKSFFP